MMEEKANKSHRTPKAGPKAEKKKQKLAKEDPNHAKSLEAKGRNPKVIIIILFQIYFSFVQFDLF